MNSIDVLHFRWSSMAIFCLLSVCFFINMAAFSEDRIVSMKAPSLVYAGQEASVFVCYETTTNRDVWVSFFLNRPPWTTYGAQRILVEGESGSINFKIPIDEKTPSSRIHYKIRACLLPVGEKFYSNLDIKEKAGVGCKGLENKILGLQGPECITTEDSSIVVPVTYRTVVKRFLHVDLLDEESRTSYGHTEVEVAPGTNTVEVVVDVSPKILPKKKAYMYSVNLIPYGFTVKSRLDFLAQKGVDCIVPEREEAVKPVESEMK